MSRGKFVSHDWVSVVHDLHGNVDVVLISFVARQIHSLHSAWFLVLVELMLLFLLIEVIVADFFTALLELIIGLRQAVDVQFFFSLALEQSVYFHSLVAGWVFLRSFEFLFVAVDLVENGFGVLALFVPSRRNVHLESLEDLSMHESSLIRSFIDDHCVFNIIASVTQHCDDRVHARGILVEVQLTHCLVLNQRLLDIGDRVGLVVVSLQNVVTRSPHGLLRHLALVHVSRGLIVNQKGNLGRQFTQNAFLQNLDVSVLVRHVCWIRRYHHEDLLVRVYHFDHFLLDVENLS